MTLGQDVADLEVVVRDIDQRVAALKAQLEQHAIQSQERHEQLTRTIEAMAGSHSRMMTAMDGSHTRMMTAMFALVLVAMVLNAALVGVSMSYDSAGKIQVEGGP